MGIGLFAHWDEDDFSPNPNPDPYRFKIVDMHSVDGFVIARVHYEGCNTFEGNKLLVFKNVSLKEITNLRMLDPHFSENNRFSPVARFIPTIEGMEMAIKFCKAMKEKSK